jgi:hypothetical protein
MKITPSKSQLLGWKQDRVTIWVLENLRKKFPAHPPSLPHTCLSKSNMEAGQQQVLEAIQKLCDYIPEDSAQ